MRTIEWEMPYWNWSHRWDYAELAYLMLRRPFMVERGHLDLVGRDQWVAHEYAKVRFSTRNSGWPTGPRLNSSRVRTASTATARSRFCHKHLRWPTPDTR
jgi:hypothetical protein